MANLLDFGPDLEEIRDRVVALNYFLSVEDILASVEALDDVVPAAPPAAFVAVSAEAAGPNNLIGGFRQRVAFELSVLFVENASRIDGFSRFQLDKTRKAITRQFIGWKPRNVDDPLELSRYRVVSVANGLAWGEVTFSGSYRISTDA